ncbi:hypothetical protein BJV82DRAFT_697788 [Fennellomyces sp. T-0311]|nr:hypothetical protein BJV82DRAFT_697788 [Fennellomyces sp. T-0311]
MSTPTIAIIGGGFSGLYAAIKVKKELGIQAQIFEASDDIGGAWYHNTYPNCGCDVPSHLYSLSTDLNPDWSQLYATREEIHSYMQNVAKKHELYKQTRLQAKVIKAAWLEGQRRWQLDILDCSDNGSKELETAYFDFIFLCVGSIRVPLIPEHFKTFTGPVVHTAFWDNTVDFTGKRVAVIGNGASAVQVIPALAPIVSQMYSYQRSVTWCTLRRQYSYSSLAKFIFRWIPMVALIYRLYLFLKVCTAQRGGAKRFKKNLEVEMRTRMEKQGRPDLIPKLIPEFAPGCKRLAISDNYIEALCRRNVVVQTNTIKKIQGRTIVTQDDDEQDFDILVLATGFNVAGFLGHLEVHGKTEANLNHTWRQNFPDMYKSTLINGYPNMFMILGPSSYPGNNSAVAMGECQVDFAVGLIKRMAKDKIAAIEPSKQAQDKHAAKLKSGFDQTVWKGGCTSWYMNKQGDVSNTRSVI